MNVFDPLSLLTPALLCAANMLFATLLHRVIILDTDLSRRRQFFESLSVVAFVVALMLSLTQLLLWRANPLFVLVCSAVWVAGCSGVIVVLRYRQGRRRDDDDELDIPGLWQSQGESRMAPERAAFEPAITRVDGTERSRPPPARSPRPETPERRPPVDRRLRDNLSVYRPALASVTTRADIDIRARRAGRAAAAATAGEENGEVAGAVRAVRAARAPATRRKS